MKLQPGDLVVFKSDCDAFSAYPAIALDIPHVRSYEGTIEKGELALVLDSTFFGEILGVYIRCGCTVYTTKPMYIYILRSNIEIVSELDNCYVQRG